MGTNRPASTGDDGGAPPIFTDGPPGCPTTEAAGAGSRTRSTGADVEAARQQLQRLMRDAEADVAEALSGSPGPAARSARPAARSTGLSMLHAAKLFSQNVRYSCRNRAGLPPPISRALEAGSGAPESC